MFTLIGGHVDFCDLADNLTMQPNRETGIGDDLTTTPFKTTVDRTSGDQVERIAKQKQNNKY